MILEQEIMIPHWALDEHRPAGGDDAQAFAV